MLCSLVLLIGLAFATPPKAEDSVKGKWEPISAGVLATVKPGYPGKTAGVAVDPASGDVYMCVPDNGLWKSTDRGATFERVDGKTIGGRCETGFALNVDPAGKRLACFIIYGSSAVTPDGGQTWTAFKSSHLDFGAVDWADTGRCFLALRHESGGMLTRSTDAGKTWADLGKGFTRVGLFDAKTLVCGKASGLVRSDDGGKTWADDSTVTPAGFVMTVRDGVGYWATDKGLLTSSDKGRTWAVQGGPVSCVHGPYCGKTAEHLVVVGKAGFHESTDGGKSWKQVAPLPDGFKAGGVGPNYAWDPVHDVFYASLMGKDTFRWTR
jgi:photosystem II stability/assembly factor-like uncharacterized protein